MNAALDEYMVEWDRACEGGWFIGRTHLVRCTIPWIGSKALGLYAFIAPNHSSYNRSYSIPLWGESGSKTFFGCSYSRVFR